jgi:hypothetical protein
MLRTSTAILSSTRRCSAAFAMVCSAGLKLITSTHALSAADFTAVETGNWSHVLACSWAGNIILFVHKQPKSIFPRLLSQPTVKLKPLQGMQRLAISERNRAG